MLFDNNGIKPYVEGLKVTELPLKLLLLTNLFNLSSKIETRNEISKLNGIEILLNNCIDTNDDNININVINLLWRLGFDTGIIY